MISAASVYSSVVFAVALLNIALGAITIIKAANKRQGTTFALIAACLSVWAICHAQVVESRNLLHALFWTRAIMLGPIFLPVLFAHFVNSFEPEKFRLQNWTRGVHWALIACFIAFLPTTWMIKSVEFTNWGVKFNGGYVFAAYGVYFAVAIGHATARLIGIYKRATGLKRLQSVYVILGFGLSSSFGLIASIILPLLDYGRLNKYGPIGTIAILGCCTYAIVKHRLMDLGLLTRGVVRQVLALILTAIPLTVGGMLAFLMSSSRQFIVSRSPGSLICCLVAFFIALSVLKTQANPRFGRLGGLLLALGLWNLTELVLDLQPGHWSNVFYRTGYSMSCAVVWGWFAFWKKFFESKPYSDGAGEPNSVAFWASRWVTWGAIAMSVLSFSPWVMRTLAFSPYRDSPAREIPGILFPIFGGWFLSSWLIVAAWTAAAFRKLPHPFRKELRVPVFGAFACAGAATSIYFLFVMGVLRSHLYSLFEFLMIVCLFAAVRRQSRLSGMGDIPTISYSFASRLLGGALAAGWLFSLKLPLTYALGGGLFTLTFARAMEEAYEPVEYLLDRFLFGYLSYLTDYRKWAETPRRLRSLKKDLAVLAEEAVRKAQVSSYMFMIHFEELTSKPHLEATAVYDPAKLSNDLRWSAEWFLPVLNALKIKKSAIARDEMDGSEIIRQIPAERFDLALPLLYNGRVFGMIVVGSKRTRSSLNQADIAIAEDLGKVLSDEVWSLLEHYEQTVRTETALHDALNFLANITLHWMAHGLDPEELGYFLQGIALLTDLRLMNQMAMEKQLGEKLDPAPIDLSKLLASLYRDEKLRAEKKGLVLEMDVEADLPRVAASDKALKRCLMNLIVNAVKYTAKGKVSVNAGRAEDGVLIQVRDTGPGIPAEAIPRLFEPFYRVDPTASLQEGTGLGLMIAHEYVTSIHGRITVESELGKGTCFNVWLPIAHLIDNQLDAA